MINLTPPKVNKASTQSFVNVKYHTGEIFILVVLIVLMGMYVVKPKYEDLGKRNEDYKLVKDDLASLKDTSAKIDSLYKKLQTEEYIDQVALLDEAVPLESRATRIYILMESLVSTGGMNLGSMTVEPITSLSSPGYSTTPEGLFDGTRKLDTYNITLNLTGGVQQFLGFLKILEDNPRIFDISSMEIGGDKQDILSYKLVVKTFAFGKQ